MTWPRSRCACAGTTPAHRATTSAPALREKDIDWIPPRETNKVAALHTGQRPCAGQMPPLAASFTGGWAARAEVVAIHAGDRVDADLLRARLLALAVQRAAAEMLEVHLLHHRERASVALRLALRQDAEVGHLRGGEERRRAVGARRHAGAAPDAGRRVHGAVARQLRHRDRIAVRRAAGRRRDEPARRDDPVERAAVHHQVGQYRERRCAPRLHRDHVAVPEASHVQLARRRRLRRAVRHAVDHQAAGAADPLAAVVVERDRQLALADQPLVQHVEHLEERHLRADARHVVRHQ